MTKENSSYEHYTSALNMSQLANMQMPIRDLINEYVEYEWYKYGDFRNMAECNSQDYEDVDYMMYPFESYFRNDIDAEDVDGEKVAAFFRQLTDAIMNGNYDYIVEECLDTEKANLSYDELHKAFYGK